MMDEDEKNLVLESDDPNPKAVGKAVSLASVNRNAEGFTLLRRAGPRTFQAAIVQLYSFWLQLLWYHPCHNHYSTS